MTRIIKDHEGNEHILPTYEDAIAEGHSEWCAFANEYGMFCNCGLVDTPQVVALKTQLAEKEAQITEAIKILQPFAEIHKKNVGFQKYFTYTPDTKVYLDDVTKHLEAANDFIMKVSKE